MSEYTLGSKESRLEKVFVNSYNDYIVLDPGDSTLQQRFSGLLKWMDEKEAELEKIATEMGQKYEDRPMIHEDESGNTEIDTEQFSLYVSIKHNFLKETAERIENVFGQNVLKKYFRESYEINPEFVPDEACIYDFVEEISPVLNKIFDKRTEKISKKYNKDRRGAKVSGKA